MNKEGFTLVELLAVIALVAILSGLAVTSVVSSINNSRKNTFFTDAKRMVSKAEYLLSQNRTTRDQAKNSAGIIFSFTKLNEKGEFPNDADGGKYDNNTFVKVTYDSSNNQYNYCICVVGSKRTIGSSCNATTGTGCVLSSTLTDISIVNDK